jgi:predicted nucleic acid-binding protein
MPELLDTNVIVRYLVETPDSIPSRFQGVFPFFEKVERGEVRVHLPSLVLFQAFFVLTSYYQVPPAEAAEKLDALLSFKGMTIPEKAVIQNSLRLLKEKKLDLIDAYIAAYSRVRGLKGVYSFDSGLKALGLELLPVG